MSTKGEVMKHKFKIGLIIGAEFVAIAVILLLVFFAGKKSYTVTFDLNGGTLISGDIEQRVTQGKNATPPTVAKDGCYLHSWSGSYNRVTRDITVKAVWEWNTSVGFDYVSSEDSNYCEIKGCYQYLSGDVYVGVYHDEKKVLGIMDEAFLNCSEITNIFMLDGILSIGDRAFENCSSAVAIELPGTLTRLGVAAMKNCTSLEEIVLPEGLKVLSRETFYNCTSLKKVTLPSTLEVIEEGAFLGCTALETVVMADGIVEISSGAFNGCTSLKEIVIPKTVEKIAIDAFTTEGLVIRTELAEADMPEGWQLDLNGGISIEWDYIPPVVDDEEDEKDKDDRKK